LASADVLEDVDVAALREVDGGVVGVGKRSVLYGVLDTRTGYLPSSHRTVDVARRASPRPHADGHAILEGDVVSGAGVDGERTRALSSALHEGRPDSG